MSSVLGLKFKFSPLSTMPDTLKLVKKQIDVQKFNGLLKKQFWNFVTVKFLLLAYPFAPFSKMTMKKFLLNRPIQMNCRASAILSRKIKLLGTIISITWGWALIWVWLEEEGVGTYSRLGAYSNKYSKYTRLVIHTFTKCDHEAFSLDWVCYL